ncbi:hypothetical protein [Megalodesulfovibrio paquesii]
MSLADFFLSCPWVIMPTALDSLFQMLSRAPHEGGQLQGSGCFYQAVRRDMVGFEGI